MDSSSTLALRLTYPGRVRLNVHAHPPLSRVIDVPPEGVVIGTDLDTVLLIDDPLVSPRHIVLYRDGQRWMVRDLNSENGTFINRGLIHQAAVFPGDSLQIGNTELSIQYEPSIRDIGWMKRSGEWVQIPGIIAHELKNYLHVLDTGVEHLGSDPEVERRFKSQIEVMKLAREKIDELAQNLRDGCIPPRMESVNLHEILWEQCAVLEPAAALRGIRLNVDIPPGNTWIRADRRQMGRCMLNLLKNAVEACRIDEEVSLSTRSDDRSVHVRIRDTGIGMDAETARSMWAPLFTTKPDGNGLGAFIARTVIQRHEGRVFVESMPDRGTTVEIFLPIVSHGD
ncbi:FHA domain-containing protein [bacterium]|nr:FHA domain-containing protein [candidate division CSSED10-310 bacterium]